MSLAYEMVLWDWNGTLLDDAEFGTAIINGMLRRRGLAERTREEHARLFDFPVIRYYERIGFDFASEPFETLSHEFIDAYYASVKGCPLQPGSREVLSALHRAGYRQGVLSASRQDHLEDQVGHYGLRELFEVLLGIDSVHAPGKTGRGCEWMNASGHDPSRVVLIGDTAHDAEVAAAMGIECWLVDGGHHPAERLRGTGCRCFGDLYAVAGELPGVVLERVQA